MTEALEIHIIELPKIQGKEEAQDELLDWLYFLDNPTSERTKKSMEKNKKVQDAEKELEKLNPDLLATFTELMENYERETYFDTAQMYVDGFCLGMKIMAEAYNMELSTKEE